MLRPSATTLTGNRHYKMRIVSARAISDPLAPFHPAVRDWFDASFDAPDTPQTARLARHRARRIDADPCADRQRQDTRRVPLVPRSPDVRAAATEEPAVPRALHFAAEGAGRRRRAQPAGAARGHCQRRRGARRHVRRRRPSPSAPATRRRPNAPAFSASRRTSSSPRPNRSTCCSRRTRARRCAASTRSSSTRFTRWSRPSAAHTWRCRSSASRRACDRPPQRIGLSATQRPLEEVARFLGGSGMHSQTSDSRQLRSRRQDDEGAPSAVAHQAPNDDRTGDRRRVRSAGGPIRYRPVTIVDAGAKKNAEAQDRGAGRGHGAAHDGR